jgi:hypothetical protein
MSRWPSFLIIGAAKSATTWLAQSLARHPSLFVHPEEVHFFSRHYDRGQGWYLEHFEDSPNARQIGEKSNTYLSDPLAAERINKDLPQGKLIAVLRNPVERAYSGYCMQLARRAVSPEIGLYLDPKRQGENASPFEFLSQGLYAQHLQRYQSYRSAGHLSIHLYDDLQQSSERLLHAVLSFLDVDPGLLPTVADRRVNARRSHTYPKPLARALSLALHLPGARRAAKDLLRFQGAARLHRRLASDKVTYPPLTPELAARMQGYFRADTIALQDLIDRDLSAWQS